MTIEIITQVKQLAAAGKSKKEICDTVKLSGYAVYIILTGKKYPNKKRVAKRLEITGLSEVHKKQLYNIAKNKDTSQNRLLLSYVRAAINNETAQNKIYED